MKKRVLILVAAVAYCVAPDLFVGPLDDALVLLATSAITTLTAGNTRQNRDPEYVKMERDF